VGDAIGPEVQRKESLHADDALGESVEVQREELLHAGEQTVGQ